MTSNAQGRAYSTSNHISPISCLCLNSFNFKLLFFILRVQFFFSAYSTWIEYLALPRTDAAVGDIESGEAEAHDGHHDVFIEVKTTLDLERFLAHISLQQLDFARSKVYLININCNSIMH